MEEQELSERNIRVNGKTWHLLKAAEECNELATAILQHVTKGYPEEAIQKEIADVEIAMRNLSTIYGREIIGEAKKAKLIRIERKVLEQEAPNTDFNLTKGLDKSEKMPYTGGVAR